MTDCLVGLALADVMVCEEVTVQPPLFTESIMVFVPAVGQVTMRVELSCAVAFCALANTSVPPANDQFRLAEAGAVPV